MNSEIKSLNPFELSLSGSHLVEANAGTGKTHNLAILYLRFLLEYKTIMPANLLVTTYTIAATHELKERIRQEIFSLLNIFDKKISDSQNIESFLVKNQKEYLRPFLLKNGHYLEESELRAHREHLRLVLTYFDQAAIYTFHSFCQRTLQDFPAQADYPENANFLSNSSDLHQSIILDFIRIYIYNQNEKILKILINENMHNVEYWQRKLINAGRWRVSLLPKTSTFHIKEKMQRSFAEIEKTRKNLFNRFNLYYSEKIIEHIQGVKELNKSKYKANTLSANLEITYSFLKGEALDLKTIEDKISRFFLNQLNEASTKKNNNYSFPDLDNIFQDLETYTTRWIDFYNQLMIFYLKKFYHYFFDKEEQIKQKNRIVSYDDLILKMHKAVLGSVDGILLQKIREKYSAALIDEYQDSDSLQSEIFTYIFSKAHKPIFFIGDPKQSIYAFRGADVFAYLNTKNNISNLQLHSLLANFRSHPNYIQAVNIMFQQKENPFLISEIHYQNSLAGKKNSASFYLTSSNLTSLLNPNANGLANGIHFLYINETIANKATAWDKFLQTTTNHISMLLLNGRNNNARINDQPVTPKDIAILVRKNEEARELRDSLRSKNIASVIYSPDSIFQSEEASEMLILLAALAYPDREDYIKLSLTTKFFSYSLADLQNIFSEDQTWTDTILQMQNYSELWKNFGFTRLFLSLYSDQKLLSRFLPTKPINSDFSDNLSENELSGIRIMVNYFHLMELIQQEERNNHLTPAQIHDWLRKKINEANQNIPEHTLRIDSETEAIRIITVHNSKGLQFPIVYIPAFWSQSTINHSLTYHDPLFENQSVMDIEQSLKFSTISQNNKKFFANQNISELLQKEQDAEEMRLLYVALTRASYATFLGVGFVGKSKTNKITDLLQLRQTEKGLGEELQDWIKTNNENKSEHIFFLQNIDDITESQKLPIEENKDLPQLKILDKSIPDGWRIHSFSALTKNIDLMLQKNQWHSKDKQAKSPLKKNLSLIWLNRLMQTNDLIENIDESELKSATDNGEQHSNPNILLESLTDHNSGTELSPQSIADLPRGAETGIMMHSILENIEFNTFSYPEITPQNSVTIKSHILRANLKPENWFDIITKNIDDTLQLTIKTPRHEFQLRQLSTPNTLVEMPFFFSSNTANAWQFLEIVEKDFFNKKLVNNPQIYYEKYSFIQNTFENNKISANISSDDLKSHSTDNSKIDLGHSTQKNASLDFSLQGFFQGFIDLVFRIDETYYILDWKSNHLVNSSLNPLHPSEIIYQNICSHHYYLQYYIYTIALHRFLRSKKPQYDYTKNFGGIIYFYLRGAGNGQPDYFFDYIQPDIIEKIDQYFSLQPKNNKI